MKEQISDVVETYESLVISQWINEVSIITYFYSLFLQSFKQNATLKEIADIQLTLSRMTAAKRNPAKIDIDDVDAYMEALQAYESSNKKSSAVLRVMN